MAIPSADVANAYSHKAGVSVEESAYAVGASGSERDLINKSGQMVEPNPRNVTGAVQWSAQLTANAIGSGTAKNITTTTSITATATAKNSPGVPFNFVQLTAVKAVANAKMSNSFKIYVGGVAKVTKTGSAKTLSIATTTIEGAWTLSKTVKVVAKANKNTKGTISVSANVKQINIETRRTVQLGTVS